MEDRSKLLALHVGTAAYLGELERTIHFLSTLSQPQYGSLANTQSLQDKDLLQVASGICAAPLSEPA